MLYTLITMVLQHKTLFATATLFLLFFIPE